MSLFFLNFAEKVKMSHHIRNSIVCILALVAGIGSIGIAAYHYWDTDKLLVKLSYMCIDELSNTFGTDIRAKEIKYKVETGNIYFYGFEMQDLHDETMLKVDTLEAHIDAANLWERKVMIHSIKLHGVEAKCYKDSVKGKPNYQFVIDRLKEMRKGKKKQHTRININLWLNDLCARRVNLHWDVRGLIHRKEWMDKIHGTEWFDPAHFWMKDMHVDLKGDILEEKTMNITATDFQAFEAISGFGIAFDRMTYRTIRDVT